MDDAKKKPPNNLTLQFSTTHFDKMSCEKGVSSSTKEII
jgi:hypothetical protein